MKRKKVSKRVAVITSAINAEDQGSSPRRRAGTIVSIHPDGHQIAGWKGRGGGHSKETRGSRYCTSLLKTRHACYSVN